MMKQTALVKVSGDLLENQKFFAWLREKSEQFIIFILVGGGKQINDAFRLLGLPIKFGPDGSRITETQRERKVAEYVLGRNRKKVQDFCDKNDIPVKAIVPIIYVDSKLRHINGDDYAILAPWLFDKVFVMTLKNRLEVKRKKFKDHSIEIVGL